MSANREEGDSSSSAGCSSPEQRSESRGSSVSAGLREEYEDLLKYTVVAPKLLDGSSSLPKLPPTVTTERRSSSGTVSEEEEEEGEILSSLPSQLPTPPQPTSPPPHPSLQHLSHSPSPPPQFTMSQPPLGLPPPSQNSPFPDPHTRTLTDDITRGSHAHDGDAGTDPEVTRLGTQLDTWCLELKRNVLAEFEQARLRLLESHQRELERQLQQQAYAMRQVQDELERHKELVATYENSVARKDQLIASLNTSMEKQKSRVELQKSFSTWKIQRHDDQREAFTSTLARRHYHSRLQSRVWGVWFGLIRGRWRQRVERACQTRAEEVCVQLTTEYEERLAASQRSLDESQQEIQQLKTERNMYEQNMKQAFMRGVCALNLEAMTMFRQHDATGYHGNGLTPPTGEGGHSEGEESDHPSLELAHPPQRHTSRLPPSESAPSTHHHGDQTHPPPHLPSSVSAPPTHSHGNQPPHLTPLPHPSSQSGHVTTSLVQVRTSQLRTKAMTRGQSSVGVASHRGGRGRPRPAVMVERHTLEQ